VTSGIFLSIDHLGDNRGMTASLRDDLAALVRCAWMGRGVGKALGLARAEAGTFLSAFDRAAWPIVVETVGDEAKREHLRFALGSAGVKVSYLLCSYARMAGLSFPDEPAVLVGAFARLYDDLLDERPAGDLDSRLAGLFAGEPFAARDDLELLAARIHAALVARLGPIALQQFRPVMAELHRWQVRSRAQQTGSAGPDERDRIVSAKGGLADVLLLGLVNPGMTEAERDRIHALGEALQLLDDYQDIELDRRSGIATAATDGRLELHDIARRLRDLGAAFAAEHGRQRAAVFEGVLFIQVLVAFARRRVPRLASLARSPTARTWSPLRMLIEPGGAALDGPSGVD
jgi:hypothetical protein